MRCGIAKMGSSTTFCTFRMEMPCVSKSDRWWDCCRCALQQSSKAPPTSCNIHGCEGLIELFKKRHPELLKHVAPADGNFIGYAQRRLLSVCNKEKLERILGYMLDENEFFGPYGIRSLSKYHLDHPFIFDLGGQHFEVKYLPAESNTGMFGGNSNWRGPVWMPVNALLIRSLLNLYQFYGDDFKVECPTGSGQLHDVVRSREGARSPTVEHLSSR